MNVLHMRGSSPDHWRCGVLVLVLCIEPYLIRYRRFTNCLSSTPFPLKIGPRAFGETLRPLTFSEVDDCREELKRRFSSRWSNTLIP